ncbi:hypothetical protein CPT_Mendera_270 [Stenotrophomonas phage Mendera]|uniref:SET domain-containing protein n=1 Tax=Stenotrophomonas phage Mendera TaxID=2650877 RepID=A0A5P8PJ87_9CAUD|nr:hypothetical protein HWC60_gp145 [Stenotrophomonas phage Mendera]QFR56796.1 hypothetical protein CPT_Mendera_270 [Stenotrophomonas phage Mendera]
MNDPFYIQKSEVHGRGCFAARKILTGEMIRVAVILVQRDTDSDHLFPWDRENKSICLSAVSLCNSSEKPNLKIIEVNKEHLTKTFRATRDIEPGEEIFLKYRI